MPVKQKPVRTRFFNFDSSLIDHVRVEFGLDSPVSLRPILMDGPTATLMEVRSKTSRKAVISTPSQRFFLKEVPWYCDTPEFLTFSNAFQEQLRRAGAPVPGVCRTATGSTWIDYGERRLTLAPFIKGRRYQFASAQAEAAGRALRQIHTLQDPAALPPYDGDDFIQLTRDHLSLIPDERPDVAQALAPDIMPNLRSLADEFASTLARNGFAEIGRASCRERV